MLEKAARKRLHDVTVEMLLEMRAAYLAAGANPLKHWDQLQDRLRSSARTSAGVAEWSTAMARALRLPAPNSRYSDALVALDNAVDDVGTAEWLAMLDAEWGLLIALARACAERRKEARDTTTKETAP
jgi:hypothetical protein